MAWVLLDEQSAITATLAVTDTGYNPDGHTVALFGSGISPGGLYARGQSWTLELSAPARVGLTLAADEVALPASSPPVGGGLYAGQIAREWQLAGGVVSIPESADVPIDSVDAVTSVSYEAPYPVQAGMTGADIPHYFVDVYIWQGDSPEPGPSPGTAIPQTDMIGRVSRAYVSAHDRTRVHHVRLRPQEKHRLIADFNGALPAQRTIVSAVWQMETASAIGMGAASILDGGRAAQVLIEAVERGQHVYMRCQATLDSGEVYTQVFRVDVLDGPVFGDAGAIGPTRLTATA